MSEGNGKVVVRIADVDETPVPILADEALKMCADIQDQLGRATNDDQRFWLCAALASCEQLAAVLLAHGGQECNRWRDARTVSMDNFGRMVHLSKRGLPV